MKLGRYLPNLWVMIAVVAFALTGCGKKNDGNGNGTSIINAGAVVSVGGCVNANSFPIGGQITLGATGFSGQLGLSNGVAVGGNYYYRYSPAIGDRVDLYINPSNQQASGTVTLGTLTQNMLNGFGGCVKSVIFQNTGLLAAPAANGTLLGGMWLEVTYPNYGTQYYTL
jgi:hypothetical protein